MLSISSKRIDFFCWILNDHLHMHLTIIDIVLVCTNPSDIVLSVDTPVYALMVYESAALAHPWIDRTGPPV